MQKRLDYRIQTSIVLSTEDFINSGLTQEEMIESIEKCTDYVWSVKKYPINSNILVTLKTNNHVQIEQFVWFIEACFQEMLIEKN